MTVSKLNRLILTVGALFFLAGCGGGGKGPSTVPSKGVVTYQGKPVAKLTVTLTPEKGMMATGMTDSQGQFTLMTNKPGDGAMVGNYKVGIKFVPDQIPEMPGFSGTETKPPESPIPAKYSDPVTSGLTATVVKDASKNNFNFQLTD